MKTFVVLFFALLVFFHASAQVSMELALDQEQFLPGENIPVAVKITNQSGQQMHLGAEDNWLTFNVEAVDGFVVVKNAEVPVVGEFDLESSQLGIKHVDLAPYFQVSKPGRYKITATLRIKQWSQQMTSAPKSFDVINGAELWSQDFGVPSGTNAPPEVRKYTLVEANYLRDQLRLYLRVSDGIGSQVIRVTTLGAMVSFSQPQAQVDRTSQLHVLWQTGAQLFNYCIISPDGVVAQRELYDIGNIRPRLTVNDRGDVLVNGGVRRPKPTDLPAVMPVVKMPNDLPAVPAKP
jgi:hypothetical protein